MRSIEFISLLITLGIAAVGFTLDSFKRFQDYRFRLHINKFFALLMYISVILLTVNYFVFNEELPPDEQPIVFADPYFESVIREAFNLHGQFIFPSQLQAITELYINGRNASPQPRPWSEIEDTTQYFTISELSDIINFPNLRRLTISHNEIEDLSPIFDNLHQLEHLEMEANNISSIDGIALLQNLTRLSLGRNIISDISGLNTLTNLTHVYLFDNAITDIDPLHSLENLTNLGLSNNHIRNIAPLSGLSHLEWVNLSNNLISDASPLYQSAKLHTLFLSNNALTRLDAAHFNHLTRLSLTDNRIERIDNIEALNAIEILRLANNRIEDVSAFAALPETVSLYIANNPISDWHPLTHIHDLHGYPEIEINAVRREDNILITITSPFEISGVWYLWQDHRDTEENQRLEPNPDNLWAIPIPADIVHLHLLITAGDVRGGRHQQGDLRSQNTGHGWAEFHFE